MATPFPFFSLPAELRDMIYGLVWRDTPSFMRCLSYRRNAQWSANYGGSTELASKRSKMPKWLLTSKEVMRKANSVFHCHGNITLFEANVLNGSVYRLPKILTPLAARQWRVKFLKDGDFEDEVVLSLPPFPAAFKKAVLVPALGNTIHANIEEGGVSCVVGGQVG